MSDSIDNYYQNQSEKTNKPTSFLRCIKILENGDDLKKMFQFNELSGAVEFSNTPQWLREKRSGDELRDNDVVCLRIYMSQKYNFSPTKENIYQCLLGEAKKNSYHPIHNYLNKLQWDGISRLPFWLNAVVSCDDNAYTREVAGLILIAAVHRAFNPSVKFDYMAILEGQQDIGKSLLIKAIAGDKKLYASCSFHLSDKDLVDLMRGKWILEFEEMADFKKQDVERIKALLSRDTDRMRLSYGRLAEDFPRQSIFIGSLNPKGHNKYLQDEVANRRFWPIVCKEKIKLSLFEEMRDQLFAEAMFIYKNDKEQHLRIVNEEAHLIATTEQENRKDSDPWEVLIDDYLRKNIQLNKVFTTDILRDCFGFGADKINKYNCGRVGIILRQLGWVYRRDNSKEARYFARPDGQDIVWQETTTI